MESNKQLLGWIFHYNPFTEIWYGVPRDNYVAYMNGNKEGCVSHKDIDICLAKASKAAIELNN